MAVQTLDKVTPKPAGKAAKPRDRKAEAAKRATNAPDRKPEDAKRAEIARDDPKVADKTPEKQATVQPDPGQPGPPDPNRQFAPDRPPSHDEVRIGNIHAENRREEPVVKRAGAAGEEPLNKKGEEKGGFYAALEKGDSTAGFIASHGTWENWVSNIKTENGPRGVHETRMRPCDCRLCQEAIKDKGWTF